MRHSSDLAQDLQRLQDLENRQRAGYEFQGFVASLFRREHFSVERRARAASPRQTDLFVTRADEVYLIETKWRQRKANVDDVDTLFTRLKPTPKHVVGILCSYNGFTDGVIKRVRERSKRPVLLVSGNELHAVVDYGQEDFLRLLHRKQASLLTHREVDVDRHVGVRPLRRLGRRELPASVEEYVLADGRRTKVLTSAGDFGHFVFARSLPDVDWVIGGGRGVSTDVDLPVDDEGQLVSLLRELAELGWITRNGRWSIRQAGVNWHGAGASTFVEAITGWSQRYRDLDVVHHTEEFCYFDTCDGGLYTLSGDVSASKFRWVTHANLSFQLIGVPLDTAPLRHLCETFGVNVPVYFRPNEESAVVRERLVGDARHVVEPVAFVVEPGDEALDEPEDEWVVGIVVKHPGYQPPELGVERSRPWLDGHAADSAYLICDLRSHHPMSHAVGTYRLWSCESTWTSDAQLVRPIADWDDPPRRRREVQPQPALSGPANAQRGTTQVHGS